MQQTAAQRLAADFDGRTPLAQEAVRSLYDSLACQNSPQGEAAFAAWKTVFAQIGGPQLESRRTKLARLAKSFGLNEARWQPAELLFALHTYYAQIVTLLGNLIRQNLGWNECSEAGESLFDWVATENCGTGVCNRITDQLNQSGFASLAHQPWTGGDLFQPLYERLFPKPVRHALGEYYTPEWLAAHVLDKLGYDGRPDCRLLDPACGSGIFLLLAIGRLRAWHEQHGAAAGGGRDELCQTILRNVVGCDLNPLAALTARTNYLLAVSDLSADMESVEIPIYRCDSILSPPPIGTFDMVAGNPPWVAWDNLPAEYRAATKPLWEQYGLFSLSGTAARHGGGKKDLSMLMLYTSADRHLADGGKLGFVITQTLLQTAGSGEGFRRFRLGPDGAWLGVTRVDDLTDVRPFSAANWTSVIFVEKGNQTTYPVPYYTWTKVADAQVGWGQRACERRPTNGDLASKIGGPARPESRWPHPTVAEKACFNLEPRQARPIDPDRSNSPWLIESPGAANGDSHFVGPSDYAAHLGANSGGANGVFWVRVLERLGSVVLVDNMAECSKKEVPRVRQLIEPDLLFPLIRWGDVAPYRAVPSCYLLLAQDTVSRTGIDAEAMRRDYPLTLRYLCQFEPLLRARAAYQRYQGSAPFYSMYDVDGYTVARHKVIWRRMDRQIRAAVVGEITDALLGSRPLIPQETCVLIATDSADEAHYLCAMLSSAAINRVVQSHSVRGGKSFGSPSMLGYLNLRRYDGGDQRHKTLAALSRKAHLAASAHESLVELQGQIDEASRACIDSSTPSPPSDSYGGPALASELAPPYGVNSARQPKP